MELTTTIKHKGQRQPHAMCVFKDIPTQSPKLGVNITIVYIGIGK